MPAPSKHSVKTQELSERERRFLNVCQHGFPITERPFEALSETLGCAEDELVAMAEDLHARKIITRIGAVYRPNRLGASTLAAIAVPPERLEDVAEIVNAFPEVNHNYEREHELNLWFVAVADDEEELADVLTAIETQTGLEVVDLPMTRAFHLDLGFQL